jgi:DNA primase
VEHLGDSPRCARAGAPVSVLVMWEELPRTKGGNQYTVLNLAKRLDNLIAGLDPAIDRLDEYALFSMDARVKLAHGVDDDSRRCQRCCSDIRAAS